MCMLSPPEFSLGHSIVLLQFKVFLEIHILIFTMSISYFSETFRVAILICILDF